MKLSIVVPVYNEKLTIDRVLERIQNTPYEKEIIVVDDCSTDGTREILRSFDSSARLPSARFLYQPINQGKGAALRSGFQVATGDIILVQDADLEYDPNEYPLLIDPILSGWRMSFLDRGSWTVDRVVYFPRMVGNKFNHVPH